MILNNTFQQPPMGGFQPIFGNMGMGINGNYNGFGMSSPAYGNTMNSGYNRVPSSLTEEEHLLLKGVKRKGFELNLTPEEYAKAISNHRDQNTGQLLLIETGEPNVYLSGVTGEKVTLFNGTEEEAVAVIDQAEAILELIKVIYIDMDPTVMREFFPIKGFLEKAKDLYKIAYNNWSRHNVVNSGNNRMGIGNMSMVNTILNGGQFMPYGAFNQAMGLNPFGNYGPQGIGMNQPMGQGMNQPNFQQSGFQPQPMGGFQPNFQQPQMGGFQPTFQQPQQMNGFQPNFQQPPVAGFQQPQMGFQPPVTGVQPAGVQFAPLQSSPGAFAYKDPTKVAPQPQAAAPAQPVAEQPQQPATESKKK